MDIHIQLSRALDLLSMAIAYFIGIGITIFLLGLILKRQQEEEKQGKSRKDDLPIALFLKLYGIFVFVAGLTFFFAVLFLHR